MIDAQQAKDLSLRSRFTTPQYQALDRINFLIEAFAKRGEREVKLDVSELETFMDFSEFNYKPILNLLKHRGFDVIVFERNWEISW